MFGNTWISKEVNGNRLTSIRLILPEQGLSRQPDFILFHGFPREKQQQQHSGHGQGGSPTSMQPRAQLAQSVHEKDAVAHAGRQVGEAGLPGGCNGVPVSTLSRVANLQIKISL